MAGRRKSGELTPTEKILLGLVEAAVRAGWPAPTSTELAEAAGMATPQHAFRALQRMARRGLLRVEGDSGARIITLPDGRRTAPVEPRHAWRKRAARRAGTGEAPAGTERRDCLRCRRAFDSEGPHNRICDPCKALDSYAPVEHAVTGADFR